MSRSRLGGTDGVALANLADEGGSAVQVMKQRQTFASVSLSALIQARLKMRSRNARKLACPSLLCS
ncbi:MAG TPA: hypothetical protein VFV38_09445 [Ktedonobacteraceae bacterium]|nr:hypothetical protein [Ktedonobacteraceae bacterium]